MTDFRRRVVFGPDLGRAISRIESFFHCAALVLTPARRTPSSLSLGRRIVSGASKLGNRRGGGGIDFADLNRASAQVALVNTVSEVDG